MGGDILEWIFDHIFPWLIIAFVVFLFFAIPAMIYAWVQDSKSPTFTLRKDEWQCTASRLVPVTTYVQSGKVLIPITSTHKDCTQWSEKP